MNGSVDPETIYTKQNCIGGSFKRLKSLARLTVQQVVAASGRCTKGIFPNN